MQLFKFFHTENTSNFKTQTAKNGGFFEELLSENDFEAVLVNFCCMNMVPMLLRQFRLAQGYCSGFPIVGGGDIITMLILLRVFHSGEKHHYIKNIFQPTTPTIAKTDAPP